MGLVKYCPCSAVRVWRVEPSFDPSYLHRLLALNVRLVIHGESGRQKFVTHNKSHPLPTLSDSFENQLIQLNSTSHNVQKRFRNYPWRCFLKVALKELRCRYGQPVKQHYLPNGIITLIYCPCPSHKINSKFVCDLSSKESFSQLVS